MGPVTPPPQIAVTSMVFTPFVLKTVLVPTSAKFLQVAPLNEDLHNELQGAIIKESTQDNNNSHFMLHFYEFFQQLQHRIRVPELMELKDARGQMHLYNPKLHCWQLNYLPHILCLSTNSHLTTHGRGQPDRSGNSTRLLAHVLPSATSRKPHKNWMWDMAVTRIVAASDMQLVRKTE